MKKFILFVSIIVLTFQISYSQNEYYVATKIEEFMNEEIFFWAHGLGGIDSLRKITIDRSTHNTSFQKFDNAKKISDNIKTLDSIELNVLDSLYKHFHLDTLLIGTIDYQLVKRVVNKLNPNGNLQSGSSIVGFGLSQSEIITAISDVVIERAKQELAKMYFDKLANRIDSGILIYYIDNRLHFKQPNLNDTIVPDTTRPDTINLKEMMPNVYSFLRNSSDRMTPEMGQTFKNAFTKDLEKLFPNAIEYGLPPRYKEDHLVDDFALSSYEFIMNLIGNAGFFDASDELFASLITATRAHTRDTISMNTLTEILMTVRVLNSSLVNSKGTYEINAAHFRTMDTTTFSLFLNFLSSNPNLPGSVKSVLLRSGNRDQFTSFISGIDRVRLTLDEIGLMKTPNEKVNAISLACKSFLDAFSAGVQITSLLITVNDNEIRQLERFTDFGRRGVEFTTSLYTKNYANSALVALNLFRDTYSNPMNKDLFKYITLIADISHAQNTEEVRTIVDRAILPVGSYAIKRSTGFSIAVNAYAGIAGGLEWTNLEKWSSGSAAVGISLPIGISINWSRGNEDNMRFSNSLFVSLLDLGAIANYNLGNTEVEGETISTAPEITFANVFSPGFSYIYGWKNSPISTSIGLQYMPNLREITDVSNITLGSADAVQFKIGFLVDVPLFNIVMKGRK